VQAEGLRRLLSPKDCWENRSIVSISPEMFLAAFQSSLDTVPGYPVPAGLLKTCGGAFARGCTLPVGRHRRSH
jgi:hypothetical protein